MGSSRPRCVNWRIAEINGENFPLHGSGVINNLSVSATTNVMLDADFTKSKGAHNIHFGGGIGEFFFGNPGNAGNANGAFSFTGQWTQYDAANALCYAPASLGFAPGAPACSATRPCAA